MTQPLRILAVCTHNRARSVAMKMFLQRALAERHIAARVVGAGFNEAGLAPTSEVVDALSALGLDATAVLSRRATPDLAAGADLVVTAERAHVTLLCADDHELFHRTFTLPEFVLRAEACGPRHGRTMEEWLAALGEQRTPVEFLARAPEIADPTGQGPTVVAASMAEIGQWCERLVVLL